VKSKDSRSQKGDEFFRDLKVKATKSLCKEEENKCFGSENVGINENLNNTKHEKEVNFEINLDEIEKNFYKSSPKIRECRVIMKDLKLKIINKKIKSLASNSSQIQIIVLKNLSIKNLRKIVQI